MRWEFEADTRGGLRVIELIPDISPCLIEGRNGVGKSMAVQLLQLASGSLPDELATHTELWRSLRERIGNTRIVGTKLYGAERAEFTFTPNVWPSEPTAASRTLGTAVIDGRPVPAADFAALLHVERIAGNEDLADTIRRHRDVLEAQLAAAHRRIRSRQAAVDEFANDLISDLRRSDPEALEEEERAVADAEHTARRSTDELNEAVSRLKQLLHAHDVLRKKDSVDANADKLLADRDAALELTKKLEQDLQSAQEAADLLAERLEGEGGITRQVAQASRTRRHRESRVENLLRSTSRDARALQVAADPEAVASAIADCSERLEQAAQTQRHLDTAGQVKSVLDDVIPILDSVARELPSELLADGFAPPLTIEVAQTELAKRRTTLESEPTPTQIRELAAEISQLKRRHQQLEQLAESLSQLTRASELLQQANEGYDDLEAKLVENNQLTKETRAADAEVGRIQSELNTAHDKLADLTQKLEAQGTMSREDAERDIQETVSRLGITESQIPMLDSRFRADVATAESRLAATDRALSDARRRLTSRRTELAKVVGRLRADPRFSWLDAGSPLVDEDGRLDVETYRRTRHAVLSAVDAISDAERTIAILQGLCQEFLTPRSAEPSELDGNSRYSRPFASMLSARMLKALNSPSIRERVFDGGNAVALDPINRNITIEFDSGDVDVRAMASFSTGEQAFAFTQARISDLQPSDKPNRLLVLDEFGAFVSADRMPDLAAFLSTEAAARAADQILVILPLQVRYEDEVENTLGALRESYEERLQQILERNYCAVPL